MNKLDDLFFEIWMDSYDEDKDSRWIEPRGPLHDLVTLSTKGLIVRGNINGHDAYVWRLTPLGCLVGAAMNKDIITHGVVPNE